MAVRHPGIILRDDFMEPLDLSVAELAELAGVSQQRVYELLAGKRGVSVDTALRLGRVFRMKPRHWLAMQAEWDLDQAEVPTDVRPADTRGFVTGPRGVMRLPPHERRATWASSWVVRPQMPPTRVGLAPEVAALYEHGLVEFLLARDREPDRSVLEEALDRVPARRGEVPVIQPRELVWLKLDTPDVRRAHDLNDIRQLLRVGAVDAMATLDWLEMLDPVKAEDFSELVQEVFGG